MSANTNFQLNPDWLIALDILKREIPDEFIPRVWNQVRIVEQQRHTSTCVWRPSPDSTAFVIPKVDHLPQIERVEVYLYLGVQVYSSLAGLGILPRRQLMKLVGCSPTSSPDIRERWRLIDFETPAHLLPIAFLEDRTRCKMCKQPVATNSGAWVRIGGIELAEPDVNSDEVAYKPDVHEECMRYAHRVLVPIRKAQLEAQALKATAEVDK